MAKRAGRYSLPAFLMIPRPLFLFYHFPHPKHQYEAQYGHKQVGTGKVYPNAIKSKIPKPAEKKYRKYQCCGNGHHRCHSRFFNGTEEPLCSNSEPAEQIRNTEHSDGPWDSCKSSASSAFANQEAIVPGKKNRNAVDTRPITAVPM